MLVKAGETKQLICLNSALLVHSRYYTAQNSYSPVLPTTFQVILKSCDENIDPRWSICIDMMWPKFHNTCRQMDRHYIPLFRPQNMHLIHQDCEVNTSAQSEWLHVAWGNHHLGIPTIHWMRLQQKQRETWHSPCRDSSAIMCNSREYELREDRKWYL